MPLDVSLMEKEKGVFIISPIGPVDSDTYLVLEKQVDAVLDKNPQVIIFDLKGVNYVSSAGLGVVFKAKKSLKQNSGKLYLVNLSPPVKKVFDVVNALPEQDVFASVEELDNYLDNIQRADNN